LIFGAAKSVEGQQPLDLIPRLENAGEWIIVAEARTACPMFSADTLSSSCADSHRGWNSPGHFVPKKSKGAMPRPRSLSPVSNNPRRDLRNAALQDTARYWARFSSWLTSEIRSTIFLVERRRRCARVTFFLAPDSSSGIMEDFFIGKYFRADAKKSPAKER
jgi:hypothetical protein